MKKFAEYVLMREIADFIVENDIDFENCMDQVIEENWGKALSGGWQAIKQGIKNAWSTGKDAIVGQKPKYDEIIQKLENLIKTIPTESQATNGKPLSSYLNLILNWLKKEERQFNYGTVTNGQFNPNVSQVSTVPNPYTGSRLPTAQRI